MKKLDTIRVFEELAENISVEEFEGLCEKVKTSLLKRDRRSIELAVKFHGELMAKAFLGKHLRWEIEQFTKDTQQFILRESI